MSTRMDEGPVSAGVKSMPRSFFGIVMALVSLVFGAALLVAQMVQLVLPGRYLPVFMLTEQWQCLLTYAVLCSLILAVIGLAGGVLAAVVSRHAGIRRLGGLALSVAGIAVVGVAAWLFFQPPFVRYGMKEPHPAERTRLDKLAPESVVRNFYDGRDLSLQYWLLCGDYRRWWHDSDFDPALEYNMGLSLLRGVDDLAVVPLKDRRHPWDESQRSYDVTFTERFRGGTANVTVRLARSPGGPWRITGFEYL